MISQYYADQSMRIVIDDMRTGRHPAPPWELDKQYWRIRTIVDFMRPSPELEQEAWEEHKALRLDKPYRPYQRREVADEVISG